MKEITDRMVCGHSKSRQTQKVKDTHKRLGNQWRDMETDRQRYGHC